MDNSKNGRWASPFKKFSRVRIKYFDYGYMYLMLISCNPSSKQDGVALFEYVPFISLYLFLDVQNKRIVFMFELFLYQLAT